MKSINKTDLKTKQTNDKPPAASAALFVSS